ncbi:MAG: CapA family protein [Clostridiales bacterium]|nr:CapA family protein [Clostridiales bacterium]
MTLEKKQRWEKLRFRPAIALILLIALLVGCNATQGIYAPEAANVGTPHNVDANIDDISNISSDIDKHEDVRTNNKDGVTNFDGDSTIREPETISLTISATGDCTLGINTNMGYQGSFDEYYDLYGPSYFFENVAEIFSNDDFTIANLEGPLTYSTDKQAKVFNHRGKPKYADILRLGSIDAVSLSNNHTFDYGVSGYEDTQAALTESGIAWASDGFYGIYEVKDIKIGFVSVDEHYNGPMVEAWLESGIAELRKQGASLFIASVHWGPSENEKTSKVDEYQVQLGKKCIDLGYDLVIGNHAHVLQGIDKYKGKYIIYCLGNFCYGGSKNPLDKDSGIFRQTFTFIDSELQKDDNIQFIPCSSSSHSDRNDYKPTVVTGNEAQRIIAKINVYSAPYGVIFNAEGYATEINLTDKHKADAYYGIFTKFIEKNRLDRGIEHLGIDLSELNLNETTYLESLLTTWAGSSDIDLFIGTKTQLIDRGFHNHLYNGTGTILIFHEPRWQNLQLECNMIKLKSLQNYIKEKYIAAFSNDYWEVQRGTYIQK